MKKMLFMIMLSLSACAVKPVATPIDTKPPLKLNPAEPLKMRPVRLHVIHMSNSEKKFEEIKQGGQLPVVFALTVEDYKNLARNMQKLKSFIKTQQKIINAYRKYYEGDSNGKNKN